MRPILNDKDKARVNEIYLYMKNRGFCTKEELCGVLGWEYNKSNDRKIRELVCEYLGAVKPIVATSDSKGYKLARYKTDLEDVVHTILEIDSRIDKAETRKQPLLRFKQKCEENL